MRLSHTLAAALALAMVASLHAANLPSSSWEIGDFIKAVSAGNLEEVKRLHRRSPALVNARDDANGATPLMYAARNGHTEIVRFLLGNGADVNATWSGTSALSLGIEHIEVVRLLLGRNADVNLRMSDGRTALADAASLGTLETVKLLLDRGASVNVVDESGHTPLDRTAATWSPADRASRDAIAALLRQRGAVAGADVLAAVDRGDIEAVRRLLAIGPGMVRAGSFDPAGTALCRAVRGGHLAIAELLLEKGAQANEYSAKLRTPLFFAVEAGRIESVDLLLSRGAKADARDSDGVSVLQLAVADGNAAIAKRLIDAGAGLEIPDTRRRTLLHFAAASGQVAAAGVLLDAGQPIDAADLDGATALHLAAASGHGATVQLLMERGASLIATDREGRTPLDCAQDAGHAEVAALLRSGAAYGRDDLVAAVLAGDRDRLQSLLDLRADVNRPDREGRLALGCAVVRDDAAAVDRLLRAGARVDDRGAAADTPLQAAVRRGNLDITRRLLARGATIAVDPSPFVLALGRSDTAMAALLFELRAYAATDRNGSTPLHLAVQAGRADVAALACAHGIDGAARDGRGQTALGLAVAAGDVACVRTLLEHGARPNVIDGAGRRPLDLAESSAHPEIRALLAQHGAFSSRMVVDFLQAIDARNRRKAELLAAAAPEIVNAVGFDGDTALHRAVRRGLPAMVDWLLEHQADVSATNREGNTPLMLAVSSPTRVTMIRILAAGAAVDATARADGRTALMLAVMQPQADPGRVQMLLAHKADLARRDPAGRTALHLAAEDGDPRLVKVLLAAGADTQARDSAGVRPLDLARSDAVATLLRIQAVAASP